MGTRWEHSGNIVGTQWVYGGLGGKIVGQGWKYGGHPEKKQSPYGRNLAGFWKISGMQFFFKVKCWEHDGHSYLVNLNTMYYEKL